MNNLVLYTLTVLIWGTTWIGIKYQLDVHPIISVCYRVGLAAIVLFIFCAFTGRLKHHFTAREHGFIALMGLSIFSANYWMIYMGAQYLTSGLVALCFSTVTVMNIINQAILFKIPFNRKVVLGTILGLIGMGFVFYPEIENLNLADKTVLGLALCLIGSYFASMGNMASLRNSRSGMPIMLANAYGMFYGAILSALLAFIMGIPFDYEMTMSYTLSLLYLGIFGSAIAFTLYLTLVARMGADKAAYSSVLFPIVALGISTFAEQYHWNIFAITGVLLILAGNVLAMSNGKAFLYLVRPKGWSLFKQNPPQDTGR